MLLDTVDEDHESSPGEESSSTTAPTTSTNTIPSSKMDNGVRIPLLAVGTYHRKDPAPILSCASLDTTSLSRRPNREGSILPHPSECDAVIASPEVGTTETCAAPASGSRMMRGPPPAWLPPAPPDNLHDYTNDYEDPEDMARAKDAATTAATGTTPMKPMNSYEMSLSQQRRSQQQQVRSPLPATWEQEPALLQKNADGAYYIPSGSMRTTTSTLSPASGSAAPANLRYHEQSHLAHSAYSDASTALLKNPYGEGTLTQGRGYRTGAMKTSVKPMSHSINKSKLDEDEGGGCWWKPSKINFCLLTTLALAVLVILMLLFRAPSYVYTESSPSSHSDDASKYTELGLRALPTSISIGERIEVDFLPKHMATTELFISRAGRIQFNATVGSGAQLVLMTRAGVAPSLSLHDALYALRADRINTEKSPSHVIDEDPVLATSRTKRSARQEILSPRWTTFEQFMLEGRHYLTFINERNRIEPLTLLVTNVPRKEPKRPLAKGEHPLAGLLLCESNCNNRGECLNGKCRCAAGFTGDACEEAICPVVCSGNGVFSGGACICREGFKGKECEVRSTWCEVADCNGRGKCMDDGRCRCDGGWTGDYCDTKACIHATCNDRGVCVNGTCYCKDGWRGVDCSTFVDIGPLQPTSERKSKLPEPSEEKRSEKTPRVVSVLVPPTRATVNLTTTKSTLKQECSGHGYELEELCNCDEGWTGDACEKKDCPSCHNGYCNAEGICRCWSGFRGQSCDQQECPVGCGGDNGTCLKNGTCACKQPWNGLNCHLNGCPSECSSHGECINQKDSWTCRCQPGRAGPDCSISVEAHCDDGLDNDNDGLIDCDDPECCAAEYCRQESVCSTAPAPSDVLLRMPPIKNVPFAEKVSFLIKEKSVQSYTDPNQFNSTRVAVLSGRVVWNGGSSTSATVPLAGVRVSDAAHPLYGFTLTRSDGKFDLVVNGARSVTLQFLRTHFTGVKRTVYAAVHEITIIQDVQMGRGEQQQQQRAPPAARPKCQPWTRSVPDVSLLSNWQWSSDPVVYKGVKEQTKMVVDSRSFVEFIPIAGTSLNLVYDSSRSPATHSTLFIGLLDDVVDPDLRLVHLSIDVAGNRFTETLAPAVNLTHTFAWNRLNAFRQSEYGFSPVTVNVGYEYAGCSRDTEIVWVRRRTQMLGATSRRMEATAWTVDIHHHLNVVDNIVELGSGGLRLIGEDEKELETIVGHDEQKRELECADGCPKPALFRPTSMVYAVDGSLIVADHNLVRRFAPDGTVTTILALSLADTSHSYYLAVSPLDGTIAVSLPLHKQVWKIVSLNAATDPHANHEVLVGDGTVCTSSTNQCGDGGLAVQAQLVFPKGIAYDHKGNLYLADSRRVRVIDPQGQIRSIGDLAPATGLPDCSQTLPLVNLQMEWPTSVTSDALSGAVYVLDQNLIYEIDEEKATARIVLGNRPTCPNATMTSSIRHARDIAAGADGSVYVVESDGKMVNQIRRLSADRGSFSVVIGGQSHCSCDIPACECDNPTSRLVSASTAALNSPSAVTIHPNGDVIVADSANAKIKRLQRKKARYDQSTRQFEVIAGERNEKYTFNRHGQHTSTVSLITGRAVFNFSYNVESSALARLTTIHGPGGLFLKLTRPNETTAVMETASGQKTTLKLSVYDGTLDSVGGENGYETRMSYGTGGLLKIRQKPASTAVFHYDKTGRAAQLHQDDQIWKLEEEKVIKGRVVSEISLNGRHYATARMSQGDVSFENAATSIRLIRMAEGFSSTMNGVTSLYDSQTGPLHDEKSLLRQRTTIPAVQNPPRRPLTTRWDWRYVTKKSGDRRRNAEINGVSMFSMVLDVEKRKDSLRGANDETLLTIEYGPSGDVKRIAQPGGDTESRLAQMQVAYDSLGRRSELLWGKWRLQATYDSSNRIVERANLAAAVPIKYAYRGDVRIPMSVEQADLKHTVVFDNSNRVKEIKTPSGEVHAFSTISLGADQWVYKRRSPFSSKAYQIARDAVGDVMELVTGDEQHHLLVTKDPLGRVTRILNDEETTKVTCWTPSGHPLCTRSARFSTNATTQGGNLIVARTVQIRQFIADPPRVSTFSYEYDDLLRPTTAHFVIDGTAMEPTQLAYDEKTGLVTSLNGFGILREPRLIRINGHELIHEIALDQNGLVVKKKWIAGDVRLELMVSRDDAGRSTTTNWKLFGEESAEKRTFDAYGRLASVERAAEKTTYAYNKDSRVVKINDRLVEWHAGGVVKRVGDVDYKVDENGWTVERDNVTFDYDALGRVTAAEKTASNLKYEFIYDHLNRLVAFGRNKELTTILYGNPSNEHQITHFTTSRHGVAQLLYADDDVASNGKNAPFALIRDGFRYGVATDEFGSLRHVIGDSKLVKSVERDGYGKVLTDSDPSFFVPIGYMNGVELPDILVVILRSGRPYDVISGRVMSYAPDRAFHVDWTKTAQSIDMWAVGGEEEDPFRVIEPPKELNDWFVAAGLSRRLLPTATSSESATDLTIAHRLLSSFPERLHAFSNLASIAKSPLLDVEAAEHTMQPTNRIQFSIEDPAFADFFVVAGDSEIDLLPILTEPEKAIVNGLLGSSRRIRHATWSSTPTRHYLASPKSAANLTSGSFSHFTLVVSPQSAEIRNGKSKIIAHFGKNMEKIEEKLTEELKKKQAAAVWRFERKRTEDGRRSRFVWSERQKRELLSKASVAGFGLEQVENRIGARFASIFQWKIVETN